MEEFKLKFHRAIRRKGLSGDHIFNAGKTSLNFRMLPQKMLVSQSEAVALSYQIIKEKLTILACSNVTGSHKLKLTVIGKSKNPRAFQRGKIKIRVLYLCGIAMKKVHGWILLVIFFQHGFTLSLCQL